MSSTPSSSGPAITTPTDQIVVTREEVKEVTKKPAQPDPKPTEDSAVVKPGADGAGDKPVTEKNVEELLTSFFSPEQLEIMIGHLRKHMIPVFIKQLQTLTIPPIKQVSPEADVSVEHIAIETLEVTPENVIISVRDNNIHIAIKDFVAELKEFDWAFSKKGFPAISDAGKAKAGIHGGMIDVAFDMQLALDLPPFFQTICKSAVVKIDKLDIHISDSYASWLYNIGLAIFNSMIKTEISNALSHLIKNTIQKDREDVQKQQQTAHA